MFVRWDYRQMQVKWQSRPCGQTSKRSEEQVAVRIWGFNSRFE